LIFFVFFFIRVFFFVLVRVVSNFERFSLARLRARTSGRRRRHRRVTTSAFPPRRRRRSKTVAYTHERRVRRPGDALLLDRHDDLFSRLVFLGETQMHVRSALCGVVRAS
jgi:hypothetical protein